MARRHVPSSIDLLPPEARPAVDAALAAVRAGNRYDQDILAVFNADLAKLGLGPISRSAFSREAVELKVEVERMRAAKFLYRGLAEELEADEQRDEDRVIDQALKAMVFTLLRDPDTSPKQALELARAWHSSLLARGLSAKQCDDEKRKVMAKAETTLDAVAAKTGLTLDGKKAILDALRGELS